jgi:WD40 repeat protein
MQGGDLMSTLEGHEDRVYAVSFSADGALLASASWDGTARIWSADGSLLHVLRRRAGRLWTIAFSPSGSILAIAGDDPVIRLWDASTGKHLHTLGGHTRGVRSVSFSPAGSLLASGGADGTTRVWSLDQPPALRMTLLGLPEGWAALAPDGRYKVSGDLGGQFWHVIGMCRFDAGELDAYVPSVRQLPLQAAF